MNVHCSGSHCWLGRHRLLAQAGHATWRLHNPLPHNPSRCGDPLCLSRALTQEYWGNVNPIGERSCYDEVRLPRPWCMSVGCLKRANSPQAPLPIPARAAQNACVCLHYYTLLPALPFPRLLGFLNQRALTLPSHAFRQGKRVAETLTFDYHREHGLDVRSLFMHR